MITTKNDNLKWISNFQGEQETNDFTTLLTSIDIVTHKEISSILGYNVVLLLLLVFVTHFFEHVEQVCVLTMNVTKDFYWSFKLDEWLLIFKTLLNLLDQELDHFIRKVNEGNTLRIFASIAHDIMVKVVNDNVHDEGDLIMKIFLRNISDCLFELFTPLFLNVQRFHFVLLWFEILVE
jgi:hypothetical protein